MQIIDKKILENKFSKNIYNNNSPIFITSDDFWDGGINSTVSLKEKTRFYSLADKMSSIIKNSVSILDEEIYLGDFLCENGKMYADWSDLKKMDLFRIVSDIFKKNKCYKLSLSEDSQLIDLIVESNFKYYMSIPRKTEHLDRPS
ncbi:MAG: hypothetical protein ACI4F7_09920 [Acutalibacteraceae bacterium]